MALRGFEDREGNEWRVWSVVPAANAAVTLDATFRSGWLCFERMDGSDRRRLSLTEAPTGWEELSDERLDLLRRVAAPVAASPVDVAVSETSTRRDPDLSTIAGG